MPSSLKLPKIEENPILLAETRPNKISEFIHNLPYGDPIRAASDLVEEMQIINTQRISYANRINAMELYRTAANRIYQDLLPRFVGSSLPIAKNEIAHAEAAFVLWQEIALGYKAALLDLQNKILNINNSKSTALVVQRAIHATKQMLMVRLLNYRTPIDFMWSDLHQLYFWALQQSSESIEVTDDLYQNNESSVNLVYLQSLLLALSNTSHMSNHDILRTDTYLTKLAHLAELRGLGLISSPTGVFMIQLDSDKAPLPFSKNRDVPNADTDILLVTIQLAKRIHSHLKSLEEGILPEDESLPNDAIAAHYADLLKHLIKHFGKAPLRIFSRSKKTDTVEINLSIAAVHHAITKAHTTPQTVGVMAAAASSRWQILNVSAGGYALRKFNSAQAHVHVGDIVSIKNSNSQQWDIAVLRWANVNDLNQLDIGLELISPKALAVFLRADHNAEEVETLLLPELPALKLPATLVAPPGIYTLNQIISLNRGNNTYQQIKISKVIERTEMFERLQYNLI